MQRGQADKARTSSQKLILVTGATGKVGQHFIQRVLAEPEWREYRVRALCHHRLLAASDRLEVMRGSMVDHQSVLSAVAGASHVLHLATSKETPRLSWTWRSRACSGCSRRAARAPTSSNSSWWV